MVGIVTDLAKRKRPLGVPAAVVGGKEKKEKNLSCYTGIEPIFLK